MKLKEYIEQNLIQESKVSSITLDSLFKDVQKENDPYSKLSKIIRSWYNEAYSKSKKGASAHKKNTELTKLINGANQYVISTREGDKTGANLGKRIFEKAVENIKNKLDVWDLKNY